MAVPTAVRFDCTDRLPHKGSLVDVASARPLHQPAAQPTAGALAIPGLLLKAMRPRQWTKNLLCTAALVMANRVRDGASDLRMLACVLLFCALSGTVYLINDSLDVQRDRIHPTKRLRPIASGRLPVRVA